MKVLFVLVTVPLALLFLYLLSYRPHPLSDSVTIAPTFFEQPWQDPIWVPDQARDGWMPRRALVGQVRPVVRGSFLLLLVVVGIVGFMGLLVVRQVRRGAWTWSAVLKTGALALGVCVVLGMGLRWVSLKETRGRAEQKAQSFRISMESLPPEAPRMRPLEAPERSEESKRYRDVEVWRRESVLGFVPSSPGGAVPSWCREGLETEPETERLHDTVFLSARPEGRDWLAGYSSQNPEIGVAQEEALASARRKLALEALLQVKRRVPALDVLPLEDLAARLATRYSFGDEQATYIEKATLEHEQRVYGTVFRAACRIRADPQTIDALARRICGHVDSWGSGGHPDLRVAFFSGMVLVVLAFSAFLVYVFFRAGATGRWALPLRLLSSGILAVIVAAVVYVSVMLGAL